MFNIDSSKYNVIDISYLVVPGANPDRPFDVTRGFLADNSYKYDIHKTHTHVGTHIESSVHFFDDGKSIDEYELSSFYGRAVLLHVDLEDNERYITADYIDRNIGDILKEGDIVVCRNARQDDVKDKKYLTEEAALYFKKKKVKMVVFCNNISMGDCIAAQRKLHEVLMRDTTFLEIVSNAEKITKREFFLMALPIYIKGLDSSWCRAIIIEDK